MKNHENIVEAFNGFRLMRHFTITAIFSIVVSMVLLGYLYQKSAQTHILDEAKHNHEEVARLYTSFLWPDHGEFLLKQDIQSVRDSVDTNDYQNLHHLILKEIQGSRVIKIKIFNKEGLTVYSSDVEQVGIDKKGYLGFETALSGVTTSDLSFRQTFSQGEHTLDLKNRDISSSYVPIFNQIDPEKVDAVFELYSDATHLVDELRKTRTKIILITILVMLLLFAVLIINIKCADHAIKRQENILHQMREKAYWQANHDNLTGLANRGHFRDLLERSIDSRSIKNDQLAVMFIDLDLFKPINDAFGHNIGDKVLQEVAERIRTVLPPSAVLARLGGDEFTAFFHTSEEENLTISLADNLLAELEKPFVFDDVKCSLTASIGLTTTDQKDATTDSLIAEADSAMYLSKINGRGKVNMYTNSDLMVAA